MVKTTEKGMCKIIKSNSKSNADLTEYGDIKWVKQIENI
jgi:hypothetical protein